VHALHQAHIIINRRSRFCRACECKSRTSQRGVTRLSGIRQVTRRRYKAFQACWTPNKKRKLHSSGHDARVHVLVAIRHAAKATFVGLMISALPVNNIMHIQQAAHSTLQLHYVGRRPKSLIRFHAWHEKYPKSLKKKSKLTRNHVYVKTKIANVTK